MPRPFGRYDLLLPIGRGGMGQVWVARLHGDRGFQRLVAIKTISSIAGDLPLVERMLQEEARLASLIQHPNVVHTLDLGEHEGTLYLVMEWVDGESLNRVMKRAHEREHFPLAVAVNLMAQTCRGLHAAHEARDQDGRILGLVHRDVSPHNILITHSGTAKLFDFGVAKAMYQATSFTEVGQVKGKLSYMAPEQLLGKSVDRRADIFALGIVLYWLTTGHHPFRGETPGESVLKITNDEPASAPTRELADYPVALERIVLKSLEKDPAKRFRTAEQMCVELQRALPEAFEIGMDVQIRDYLRRIIGDQALERRNRLRRAQEMDNLRPHSTGSYLSALPSDSPPLAGSARVPKLQATSIGRARAARHPKPARPRTLFRTAVGFSVAGLVLTLGFSVRQTLHIALLRAGAPSSVPLPVAAPVASTLPAAPSTGPDPSPATPLASASVGQPKPSKRTTPAASRRPKVHKPARDRETATDGSDVGLIPPEYVATP